MIDEYTMKDLLNAIRKRNRKGCLKGYSNLRKRPLYDYAKKAKLINKTIPRAKGREGKKIKKRDELLLEFD